jgi:hypothetical protein
MLHGSARDCLPRRAGKSYDWQIYPLAPPVKCDRLHTLEYFDPPQRTVCQCPSVWLHFAASPLEEAVRSELAVPPRRENLWGATPDKHCCLGPEPVSGCTFRAAVSDWQRTEEPFAGPMVRIRFPPAESPCLTQTRPMQLENRAFRFLGQADRSLRQNLKSTPTVWVCGPC